jgi:hypothetical protein
METRKLLKSPFIQWHEKAALVEHFHRQMVKRVKAARGKAREDWSYGKTAEALGISNVAVYEGIEATRLLKEDPGLRDKYPSASALVDGEQPKS